MSISDEGLAVIKEAEGFRGKAYLCPAGVWTIGYGHTGGVTAGQTVSRTEAERLLRADVAATERGVSALAADASAVKLSQGQFDALVSFAFNVGLDALRRSALWRKVAKDPADATIATEFGKWVYAGGRKLPGLIKRRAKEAALWQR